MFGRATNGAPISFWPELSARLGWGPQGWGYDLIGRCRAFWAQEKLVFPCDDWRAAKEELSFYLFLFGVWHSWKLGKIISLICLFQSLSQYGGSQETILISFLLPVLPFHFSTLQPFALLRKKLIKCLVWALVLWPHSLEKATAHPGLLKSVRGSLDQWSETMVKISRFLSPEPLFDSHACQIISNDC